MPNQELPMTKLPPQELKSLQAKWEKILADEGMAEVSLFDNTGKNARAVQFISASGFEGEDLLENVNIEHNGCVLRFENTTTAIAHRKISHDVASLPSSWPAEELKLLRTWSESGNLLGACKDLAIPLATGQRIRRRFERFVKDSIQ